MDHAVTVVGYGNDGSQNYYIVRNSWGPNWGDKGYVKIASSDTGAGICGI
jgi:C1A family cysteine protease